MITKDLVAASARPLILTILSQGESYGYEIIQQVKTLSGGHLQWKDGMLYPVLHRLKAEDLIEDEWRSAPNGRRRKYYRLKKQGHTALAQERKQWDIVQATLEKLWGDKPCLT